MLKHRMAFFGFTVIFVATIVSIGFIANFLSNKKTVQISQEADTNKDATVLVDGDKKQVDAKDVVNNPAIRYDGIAVVGGTTFKVETARKMSELSKGLSGRDALADDEGMLFFLPIPAKHGFWMKGLLYPLDIIWIRDNEVIGIEENVPTPNGTSTLNLPIYYPPKVANKVLEINAGLAKQYGISVGDMLEFRDESF